MALNIKDPEIHRMVAELAKLTGQTQTAAVKQAVCEALRKLDKRDRVARMMDIARQSAPLFPEGFKSTDIDDLLYDENGLVK